MKGMHQVQGEWTNIPGQLMGDLRGDPGSSDADAAFFHHEIPARLGNWSRAFPNDDIPIQMQKEYWAALVAPDTDTSTEDEDGLEADFVDMARVGNLFNEIWPAALRARLGQGGANPYIGNAKAEFMRTFFDAKGDMSNKIKTAKDFIEDRYPNLAANPGDVGFRKGGRFHLGEIKSIRRSPDGEIYEVNYKSNGKGYKLNKEDITRMLSDSGDLAYENAKKLFNQFPDIVAGEEFAFVRTYITRTGEERIAQQPQPGDIEIPGSGEVMTVEEVFKEVESDTLKHLTLEELQNHAASYVFPGGGQPANTSDVINTTMENWLDNAK